MRRVVLILLGAAAVLVPSGGDASADTSGVAETDSSGADATATVDVSDPGSGGGTSECEFRLLTIGENVPVYDLNGNEIVVDGTGNWYEKWCGTVFAGAVYITPVDPFDLRDEATRRLDLPLPAPLMSPTSEQIVNLTTWLWLDPGQWQSRQETAAVPGVTVTVTASPELMIWTMGDGVAVVCAGPGTPYDSSQTVTAQSPSCSHIYTRSSANEPDEAFSAAVTVRWRLSWTVAGAAGGGPLGTIDRTTAISIPVAEVQTVNLNAKGES